MRHLDNNLLYVVIILTLTIAAVAWGIARYRECRAHGFSPTYCIAQ